LGTHYGLPLFLFKEKGCMVIIIFLKEKKRGKEKKTKQKLRRTSREYAQSGTRSRTRAVEKKRETRNEH
jgi:hypothetical protein